MKMVSMDPNVWIGAILTMAIMSYAYRDNPIFKFAERTFVATVIGHAVVMGANSLKQFGIDRLQAGNYLYVIPMIIGIALFTRYHSKYYWLSRYGAAILVGVGVGLSLRTVPKADIINQIITTITPGADLLVWGLTVVATFTVILYFTFIFKGLHKGTLSTLPEIGKYFMVIAFGAAFGNTVVTRLNLLIGRIIFLLRDWLGLMLTLILRTAG